MFPNKQNKMATILKLKSCFVNIHENEITHELLINNVGFVHSINEVVIDIELHSWVISL